jgi:MFS transporter, OFA family, oxalate/formate antiporter
MMSANDGRNWRGWTIAFTGAAINVILGGWYAWSVIGRAIGEQWHWTQTQCSLPFAVATVSFALTMVFAGRVQDSTGPRRVAMAGGLLLGSAMILSSFSTSPWVITLTYGVLGGMGIGVGYCGTVPAALKWASPNRKGLMAGIVVAGVGLAAVFMAPLTHHLLGNFGIQGTFRVLGIGTLVSVGLLGSTLRNPPAGFRIAGRSSVGGGSATREWHWREMIGTWQFYNLWLIYVLSAAPGLMIIANSVQILSMPSEQVFNPVLAPMIVAGFGALGRVLGGFASDWLGRRTTLIIIFVVQAANVAALSLHATQPAVMVGFALAGLLYGAFFPLLPTVVAEYFGLSNLGLNYGLVATAFGVAGLSGILLGGQVKDLLRTYDPAYWIFAAMLAAAALLASQLSAPSVATTESGG